MDKNVLVVINSGSSSIKFAAYEDTPKHAKVLHGLIENINSAPTLKTFDANNTLLKKESYPSDVSYEYFFELLLSAFESNQFNFKVSAVGHRVVHGGTHYSSPMLVTNKLLQDLKQLIPFAPLHQPYNLKAIECIQQKYPNMPQVVCFDTAFHRTHPIVADRFGLPRHLTEAGVRRYGFHGLSYEFVIHELHNMDAEKAKSRVIVAHLGNGASMCAVKNEVAIDSTMGFTALDGLVMGSRCGNLDPGVVLYLMQYQNMSCQEIEDMLYKKSGLLGVSGISNNMKILLADSSEHAEEAIALYVYRIRRELGAFIATLGGLDVLVFTGGVGENAWQIRERVCQDFDWLGLSINTELNKSNHSIISEKNSSIEVRIIPTNEEWMIANHTFNLLQKDN